MLSNRNLAALTGLAALLASFVLFAALVTRPGADPGLPIAGAAPATTTAASGYSSDDRGYLNSPARCPEGQSAVALGRTQRSLVAICTTPGDGPYEYRGVRISDGAVLQTDVDVTDAGFVARTDGATYTVSPTELTVVSGGKVIYSDTWIDYRRPRYSAENGGSGAAATTSPTAAATTSPTAAATTSPTAATATATTTVTATVTTTATATATTTAPRSDG